MRISACTGLTRTRKIATAGLTAAAGLAAVTMSAGPGVAAGNDSHDQAKAATSYSISAAGESGTKAAQAVHEQHVQAEHAKDADKAAAGPSHPDKLDGWIKEARSVMKKHGIPGSYEGIKKNIIRESGGNPGISNTTDVNAQNGTPSKGLLQVIQPTFDQYHVKGTKDELTDPVANIAAASNYAADRYGSMDNVDSAY